MTRPAMSKMPRRDMRVARWVSTVFTLTPSVAAISLVALPSAIICRTSRWRDVRESREDSCLSAPGSAKLDNSCREIHGLKYISPPHRADAADLSPLHTHPSTYYPHPP